MSDVLLSEPFELQFIAWAELERIRTKGQSWSELMLIELKFMTISAQVLSVQAKHPLSSFASGGDRRILVSGGGTSRGRM
jgi:hypothetical protein